MSHYRDIQTDNCLVGGVCGLPLLCLYLFFCSVFLCLSASLSFSELGSNELGLLLSEQHDSVEVCTGLLGEADCKCSPGDLFCLLISLSPTNISALHMHADCSEASDSRCKCQHPLTSQLCIPLLSLLSGNELTE